MSLKSLAILIGGGVIGVTTLGSVFSGGEVTPTPSVVPTTPKVERTIPKAVIPKVEAPKVVVPAKPKVENCHPSYSGCLKPNASDYDCAGGSGNGPYYTGTVQVYGPDVFGLDRDNDGWGCE